MPSSQLPVLDKHIDDIKLCVANFDIDVANYNLFTPTQLNIKGDESNKIYIKGNSLPIGIELILTEKAKNCTVFIEDGIKAKANKISLKNEGNFLYLGRNSTLNNVGAVILGRKDFIIVGEGIAITAHNTWSTGFNSGNNNNGLIIGDHCLIASEIIIRPGDGHLVIDIETNRQLNVSHKPVVIEPYCWIAQRAAILKNVRIGACSIISLGAVVTKSCDRFSVLSGVPAKATPLQGKMWLRGPGNDAKEIQKLYMDRFYRPGIDDKINTSPINNIFTKEEIANSLKNWEFSRTINIVRRTISVESQDFGLAIKFLLDLGHLDEAFNLVDEFESRYKSKVSSYPKDYIEQWNTVVYCSRLMEKVRNSSNSEHATSFFTQIHALCERKSFEFEHVLMSLKKADDSLINKDIDEESNMILSFAVLKLIDYGKLDDELGIKISLHLHTAKNINSFRRRHLLKELVVYFYNRKITSFFSLPKAFSNHLHKIINTLQSYSNRESGAKSLYRIISDKIREHNDFTTRPALNSPKRVAICVSGMMKIDDAAMQSLYKNIAEPLNADIFIHTWDKIQVWSGDARKSGFWQRQFKLSDNKVPQQLRNMDSFQAALPLTGSLLLSTITDDVKNHLSTTHYSIKKLLIENEESALQKWSQNERFMSRGHLDQFKMYYGIKRSFDLLESYENSNGFKYDVIIRTRPDMFITKEFDKNLLNEITENSVVVNAGSVGPNDGIFYAFRHDYEKIVSIWDEMLLSESLSPFINFEKYDSHVLLYAWFCYKNIEMKNIDDIFYDLAATSSLAKIPGLKEALENDLTNFDPSKLSQKQYADLFDFLIERSK
ncbi:acyltransferase [Aeromonas bivalvium]|uniref:acyltransferase n=1 Tax=Aeromonas bivalvium TaxID=440079 RepID=UPI0038D0AE31